MPSTGDDSPTASCLLPCAGNVEDPENMALATASHAALLSRLPMVDRGIKRARFCVLRLTTIPAVLIEGGFVSNVQEAGASPRPPTGRPRRRPSRWPSDNYQAATGAPGPPPILAGAGKPEHPSLSITPGMVQMQNGIPSIGANTPIDQTVNRVNNFQQGPTVVVPHSN